ncbi:ABC transporter permease [Sphaerochaeta sp. PS]|uniref:ABC transporter permease n=1 Tax=Sphaerochaeta sp. PS TaxID=3076336 RepID=UPI0028A47E41|nr:FtsX-like permease family protein [Sphaerochaeta sp. PS]MDT4761429.1 FtsX-like permease family protein [Sphaerochaeta sp. PS]
MSSALVSMLISRKLGIHSSRSAKKRILYNVLLVTLVVASLVFAQLFVVSMSNGIANKYALLGNGHLQVHEKPGTTIPTHPEIVDVQLVAQTFSLVYSPSKNLMVRLKGVESSYFNEERKQALTFLDPPLDANGSTLPQVLLSTTLANLLGVGQGDRIALMMINNTSLRPQLCIVGNLYDSGYKELDENLMFCDISLMEKLFSTKADTYYEILVANNAIRPVRQFLEGEGLSVTSWDQENYAVATNLETSRQAVLGVMIVVAILCGYFISELSRELIEDDKNRIALLKLLGASNALVRSVYFSTVMIVTLISILLGTALGILLGLNLGSMLSWLALRSIPALSFYLLDFPVTIPLLDIAKIVLVLVLVSALSVVWSIRRVRKIPLLQSTRFD